jgi:crotonobetainyl-CoA:carnitine CoA-transferase CaiB-like acyl-CoA transferase
VKVEAPEGDDTRRWGPPFIRRGEDLDAAYFHCCNRGKAQVLARRVRVDLPAAEAPGGLIPSIRTPIVFSDADLALRRPSPRLGEHTAEVMQELGIPYHRRPP